MKELNELDEELILLLNNKNKSKLINNEIEKKNRKVAYIESSTKKTQYAGTSKMMLNVLISQAELLEQIVNTDSST